MGSKRRPAGGAPSGPKTKRAQGEEEEDTERTSNATHVALRARRAPQSEHPLFPRLALKPAGHLSLAASEAGERKADGIQMSSTPQSGSESRSWRLSPPTHKASAGLTLRAAGHSN